MPKCLFWQEPRANTRAWTDQGRRIGDMHVHPRDHSRCLATVNSVGISARWAQGHPQLSCRMLPGGMCASYRSDDAGRQYTPVVFTE
jgi:hypothetical protein